jgi:DnaJ-class molecular chaperone
LFTGGRKKSSGPRKGKPKLIELQVTLEEVYNGAMKNVKIKRFVFVNAEPAFVNPAKEKEVKTV